MQLRGLRHAGLTVTDLDRSVRWYGRVLGFTELFREEHEDRVAAVLRSGATVIGLVRFATTDGEFSPRRVGLDHLCFTAPDREELEGWVRHLDSCAVPHSGIAQMATGPIVTFTDPDGIALAVSLPLATEEEAHMSRTEQGRVVNPWSWQDRAGFVQGREVIGAERTLFCAGVVSVDGEGTPMHPGDMTAQAMKALDNLEEILAAGGYSLADVVRLTTYVTSVDDYVTARPAVLRRLADAGTAFAATLLGVSRLARPELLIELEATAAR